MKEELKKTADIQPGDIIFECPQCGKSLAIDPRGAGYMVVCPDCKVEVQVPTSEEGDAGAATMEDLRQRVDDLEVALSLDRSRFETIGKEIVLIQAALDRITASLQEGQQSP